MGFWGTLGKGLLTAAPYVAAPFTGGASLMAAPLANKAVGAWNQRDANKGQLSGVDRGIGMAGGIAGAGASMGAFGGGGIGPSGGGGNLGTSRGLPPGVMNFGQQGNTGIRGPMFKSGVTAYGSPEMRMPGITSTMSPDSFGPSGGGGNGIDWGKILGYGGAALGGYGLGRAVGGGGGEGDGMWGPQTQSFTPSSGGMGRASGYDQSAPNLSYALTQGANEAIASQPWRQGAGLNYQPIAPTPGGSGTGTASARRGGRM